MFNYFFPENRAMYKIVWKNMVVPYTPQMTTRSMRIACWLSKTIDTLRICNTYCFSTATMVMRKRLMLRLPSCLHWLRHSYDRPHARLRDGGK